MLPTNSVNIIHYNLDYNYTIHKDDAFANDAFQVFI